MWVSRASDGMNFKFIRNNHLFRRIFLSVSLSLTRNTMIASEIFRLVRRFKMKLFCVWTHSCIPIIYSKQAVFNIEPTALIHFFLVEANTKPNQSVIKLKTSKTHNFSFKTILIARNIISDETSSSNSFELNN